MTAQVTLAGLNLIGSPAAGIESSVRPLPTGLTGWADSPPLRDQDAERSGLHGDHASPRKYAARLITIVGDLSAATPDGLQGHMNTMKGVMGEGPSTLLVTGVGVSQQATVYLHGDGVKFAQKSPTAAMFQISLKAPDPRKYGAGAEKRVPATGSGNIGSSITFTPGGNTPVPARITVSGGAAPAGYTIHGQGKIIRVTNPLTGGEVHEFDLRTGRFRRQGGIVFGYTANARLFSFPPNVPATVAVHPPAGSTATGTYALYYRDAWI